MIDNRYDENPAYNSEDLLRTYEKGDTFRTLDHDFTYLGSGKFDNVLGDYLPLSIFEATDPTGTKHLVAAITEDRIENDDAFFEMRDAISDDPLTEELGEQLNDSIEGAIISLSKIEENFSGDTDYLVTKEASIHIRNLIDVEPHADITRIGGYPSFAGKEPLGKVEGKNLDGKWVNLPFFAQLVLDDGRMVHIYDVAEPEDEWSELGFNNGFFDEEIDGEQLGRWPGMAAIFLDGKLLDSNNFDKIRVVPLEDNESINVVSERATTFDGGPWPKMVNYYQGGETDEKYPYSLMHFPGQVGFGEDTESRINYPDIYLVWDGKSKAKLIDIY